VLAARPQPDSASHGLSLPTALEDLEVHSRGAGQGARYVPPAGFGYPLGGLLPPGPRRPCFMPTALLGFALRSFLLPTRRSPRFRRSQPTCRFSRRYSRRRSGGPAQRAAASGHLPGPESLAPAAGLVRPTLAAPLGFALAGSAGDRLTRDFARAPPTRFAAPARRAIAAGVPESQSAVAGPRPATGKPAASDRATLVGFSRRHDPDRSNATHARAICFTSHRVARRRRPADAALDVCLALPQSPGIA